MRTALTVLKLGLKRPALANLRASELRGLSSNAPNYRGGCWTYRAGGQAAEPQAHQVDALRGPRTERLGRPCPPKATNYPPDRKVAVASPEGAFRGILEGRGGPRPFRADGRCCRASKIRPRRAGKRARTAKRRAKHDPAQSLGWKAAHGSGR